MASGLEAFKLYEKEIEPILKKAVEVCEIHGCGYAFFTKQDDNHTALSYDEKRGLTVNSSVDDNKPASWTIRT
jgi:hypothetical protein